MFTISTCTLLAPTSKICRLVVGGDPKDFPGIGPVALILLQMNIRKPQGVVNEEMRNATCQGDLKARKNHL